MPDPITSPGAGIGCEERIDALNKNEAMIAVPTIDFKKRWGKVKIDRMTFICGLRQAGRILAAGFVESQIEKAHNSLPEAIRRLQTIPKSRRKIQKHLVS